MRQTRLIVILIVGLLAACIDRQNQLVTMQQMATLLPTATNPATAVSITPTEIASAEPVPTDIPLATKTIVPTIINTATVAPTATRTPHPTAQSIVIQRVTVEPTETPTPTATPLVSETTYEQVNPIPANNLPGLLARHPSRILSVAASDQHVFVSTLQELLVFDMLSLNEPRIIGRIQLPFSLSILAYQNGFIVGLQDRFGDINNQMLVLDVRTPEAPVASVAITGSQATALWLGTDGNLFMKDRTGGRWLVKPEAGEEEMLQAYDGPVVPIANYESPLQSYRLEAVDWGQFEAVKRRIFVWDGEFAVSGDIVYFNIATMQASTLLAVNNANPEQPKVVSAWEPLDSRLQGYHNGHLITGILGGGGPEGGLQWLDVSDPLKPEQRDLQQLSSPAMALDGNYLYFGRSPGLHVFDVSNSAEIKPVATATSPHSPPNVAFNDFKIIHEPARQLLFVLNSNMKYDRANAQHIEAVDISSTANPQYLSRIETLYVRGLAAVEDRLFVLEPNQLRIFDTNDPENITEINALPLTLVEDKAALVQNLDLFRAVTTIDDSTILILYLDGNLLFWQVDNAGEVAEIGRLPLSVECYDPDGRDKTDLQIHQLDNLLYLRFGRCSIQRIDISTIENARYLEPLPLSGRFFIGDGRLFINHSGQLEIYDLASLEQ